MARFCARLRRCTLVVVTAYLFFLSVHAQAVTTNWIDPGGGLFTDAANWDNGVPDSDDTAQFNLGIVGYTVTFPGGSVLDPPPNYVIDRLHVRQNEVTFRDNSSPFITSPSLTVANPDVSIVVGQGAGEVAVLNTSLSSLSGANTSIGRAAGADGTLNVTAGTFNMSGNLIIGDSGMGTMNVTAGGTVANASGFIGLNAGSSGQVTVSGTNSTWANSNSLTVGRFLDPVLNARLDVNDGGMVSANALNVNHSGRLAGNGRIQGNVQNYGRIAPGNSVGTLHIDGDYGQWDGGELLVEIAAADSFDKLDVEGISI